MSTATSTSTPIVSPSHREEESCCNASTALTGKTHQPIETTALTGKTHQPIETTALTGKTSSHRTMLNYRPDLPTPELIDELDGLRRRRLVIERLVSRYLADLADRFASRSVNPDCSGFLDVFEASERLLGMGTRATRERVRVGRALRNLPRIERALESGELSFARVREITRVASAQNESIWLGLAKTLPTRELERRVAEAGAPQKNERCLAEAVAPRSGHLGDPANSALDMAGRAGGTTAKIASGDQRGVSPASGTETIRMVLDLPLDEWIVLQKALQVFRDATPSVLTDTEAVCALARETLAIVQSSAHALDATNRDPAGARRDANVDDGHDSDGSRNGIDAASGNDGSNLDDPVETRTDGIRAELAKTDGALTADDPAGSSACGNASPADSRSMPANDATPGEGSKDQALRDIATLLRILPMRRLWCSEALFEASGLGHGAFSLALLTLELQGSVRRVDWRHYSAQAA
jgi:hypothetical protein